jgi:hypothetical protein
MGHNSLGSIPKISRWKQAIDLIKEGGTLEEIADASVYAAELSLSKAPN